MHPSVAAVALDGCIVTRIMADDVSVQAIGPGHAAFYRRFIRLSAVHNCALFRLLAVSSSYYVHRHTPAYNTTLDTM